MGAVVDQMLLAVEMAGADVERGAGMFGVVVVE